MSSPSPDDVVVIVGGWTVPRAAVELARNLEDRGIRFSAHGCELKLRPGTLLTPDDYAAIRANKSGLLKLARCLDIELGPM